MSKNIHTAVRNAGYNPQPPFSPECGTIRHEGRTVAYELTGRYGRVRLLDAAGNVVSDERNLFSHQEVLMAIQRAFMDYLLVDVEPEL